MGELLSSLGINGKLLFAQTANFLIVLFILHRFVFRKLVSFVDERKAKIAKGIASGERAEKELERVQQARSRQLIKAREDAEKIVAEAVGTAKTQENEILKAARLGEEETLNRAKEEGQRERQGIVKGAVDDISKTAVLLAESVLGREITDKDEENMRKEVLEKVDQAYGK